MRLNFRLKVRSWTFFCMLSKWQSLEGLSSIVVNDPENRHYPMWDLEGCTLAQAQETLRKVQTKYNLSHIYIVSDNEGSYRAWCFSKVDLKTLLHILLDTDYVDPHFFDYTVKRKKATLRTSDKKDREPQKVESVLETFFEPIPEVAEWVQYDTGTVKRGRSLLIGGD